MVDYKVVGSNKNKCTEYTGPHRSFISDCGRVALTLVSHYSGSLGPVDPSGAGLDGSTHARVLHTTCYPGNVHFSTCGFDRMILAACVCVGGWVQLVFSNPHVTILEVSQSSGSLIKGLFLSSSPQLFVTGSFDLNLLPMSTRAHHHSLGCRTSAQCGSPVLTSAGSYDLSTCPHAGMWDLMWCSCSLH